MSVSILRKGTARFTVLQSLLALLNGLSMDKEWEVTVKEYKKKRSEAQNRLQQQWHMEAALELRDESAEDKRAYCKLHFGVPILRMENPDFKDQYDRVVRPLPYELKLDLMKIPIDFPCTRMMNVDQKTRYLNAVHQHYTNQGVGLTAPDDV